MKAIVLVGGEGTRLRPLTETCPKPLLPLLNRPFLHHVLDHLAAHGVHEVVLSSPYLEEVFHSFIEERRGDPRVTWITEESPLGTGGAIVNALDHVDDTFFVLNGDILTDLDLTAMLRFHRDRGAGATIALTQVDDARPYGLVETDPRGRVAAFREKPTDPIPGDVNAGTYLLEPGPLEVWDRGRSISVEREVFPTLIARGTQLYGFLADAYWTDLGTPERYLQGHADLLDGKMLGVSAGAPLVASGASVAATASLGRHVVLDDEVEVAAGATLERTVVHRGARVDEGARVARSILGPGARVGSEAVVEDAILGEGSSVAAGARLAGERLSPGVLHTSS